jgi:hypothetical protein
MVEQFEASKSHDHRRALDLEWNTGRISIYEMEGDLPKDRNEDIQVNRLTVRLESDRTRVRISNPSEQERTFLYTSTITTHTNIFYLRTGEEIVLGVKRMHLSHTKRLEIQIPSRFFTLLLYLLLLVFTFPSGISLKKLLPDGLNLRMFSL